MPRKKASVIKVEELIAAKRNSAEQIRSQMHSLAAQLHALEESIVELEALADSLKPKPRKAKDVIINGTEIQAKPSGKRLRGDHPDVVIYDDGQPE